MYNPQTLHFNSIEKHVAQISVVIAFRLSVIYLQQIPAYGMYICNYIFNCLLCSVLNNGKS